MIRRTYMLSLLLLGGIALLVEAAAPDKSGGPTPPIQIDEDALLVEGLLEIIAAAGQGGETSSQQAPFAEANIFFEENATDGDLGVQLFLDGDEWRRVRIFGPDQRMLLDVRVKGNAREIGLTEFFSESAEPSFDELPREEFLAMFPAGEYLMLGRTIDGEPLASVVAVTHDLPEQPEVLAPEEDEVVSSSQPLVIEWDTVPDPNPPSEGRGGRASSRLHLRHAEHGRGRDASSAAPGAGQGLQGRGPGRRDQRQQGHHGGALRDRGVRVSPARRRSRSAPLPNRARCRQATGSDSCLRVYTRGVRVAHAYPTKGGMT